MAFIHGILSLLGKLDYNIMTFQSVGIEKYREGIQTMLNFMTVDIISNCRLLFKL